MGAMTPSFRLVDLHPGKAPLIPLWSRRVRQGGGAGEAARGFVNTDKGPGARALSQHCPLQGLRRVLGREGRSVSPRLKGKE